LESLLQWQESDLRARLEKVKAARAEAALLVSEYEDWRPTNTSAEAEVLTGTDAVSERLDELVYRCRHEMLSLMPGGVEQANIEASRMRDTGALGRGVVVRNMYLDSVRNDAVTLTYARWLAGNGGKVRTAPTLPTYLIIIDQRWGLLPLRPEREQ
jgi:hypothetical protein